MQALPGIEAWRPLFMPRQIQHTSQVLKSAVGTGLFISLFLVLFRPFGMGERIVGYQWLVIAGFGPLNTLLVLAHELGIKRLLDRAGALHMRSRTGKIFWSGWTFFFIAFGNFFYYEALCGSLSFGFLPFVQFGVWVLLIGVARVAFSIMYDRLLQERNAVQTRASKFEKSRSAATEELVNIQSENGNEVLEVDLNHLLFIRSKDNYISIVQHKGGKPHLQLLRQSLKGVEDQLKQVPVVRCHRSFMVNLRQAETLQGNAQGMRILLKGRPEAIPVSRKYIAIIKARLSA